jgi:hypothetical protein
VSIDDVVVGPTGAELEALVADAVRAELVVRVAGRIVSDDADISEDRVARWALPVGAPRGIALAAEAPGFWSRVPGWAWSVASMALAVLVVLVRRSHSASGERLSRAASGAP